MTIDPRFNIIASKSMDLYTLPSATLRPPSADMEASIRAVERIISYRFRDKTLLEEALTHSSYTEFRSYERLEFVGDAVLGLALANYVFLAYPHLDQGQLTLLRSANTSTEKLARVAVRHGLYRYLRLNAAALEDKVQEFVDAVSKEDGTVVYGGSIKAPKILADIIESVAAAIYVDVNFDLKRLWVISRGLLEPIFTLEDLQQQPQPVTMLFELCQKQGKQVDIKHWRKGAKNMASVYVNGTIVALGSSEQKEIARLDAAKQALHKLSQSMPINIGAFEFSVKIEGAKQKLYELRAKKKWPKPIYSIEKNVGPPHDKKFVCSVQIATVEDTFYMVGDEKSRVKDAENSAASYLIHALQESNYL